MIQLDFRDKRPIYEQIKDKMKELIISGAIVENEKVPSVRELAAILAINPNTIQKAYKDLENEGYIYSQRAKGSFVTPQSTVAENARRAELLENLDALLHETYFCRIPYDEIVKHIDKIYNNEKG